MKIKTKALTNKKMIKDIQSGEIFKAYGKYLIKVDCLDLGYGDYYAQAVDIENGELYDNSEFPDSMEVEVINGTFVED